MRLFAERGYDNATIADIAAEAEVAPRTVTMYFPSKADIALSVPDELTERLTAVFRASPDLSFLDVVDRWLTAEGEHLDPELAGLTRSMFDANSQLQSRSGAAFAEVAAFAGPAFLRDVGLAPGHPMADVIGAATGAAISRYLTNGLHSSDQPALHAAFMHTLRALVRSARP